MTKLPGMPAYVPGIINLYSEFIPVLNMWSLLGLDDHTMSHNDQLIIIETTKLKAALWIEQVKHIANFAEEEISTTDEFDFQHRYVNGMIKAEDGTILISDPDDFFNPDELDRLNGILKEFEKSHQTV